MDEFLSRVEQAYEIESRLRGDDADPLMGHLKAMDKKMKRLARFKNRRKENSPA
jgi:hypothetical protein